MFLAPNIFRGASPKFLAFLPSLHPDSDHMAKFRGDRLRDIGDLAEPWLPKKEKKHHG